MIYNNEIQYAIKKYSADEFCGLLVNLQKKITPGIRAASVTTNLRSVPVAPPPKKGVEGFESQKFKLFEEVERCEVSVASVQSGNQTKNTKISFVFEKSALFGEVKIVGLHSLDSKKVPEILDAQFEIFPPVAAASARFANLPQELADFHREQEAIFARREASLLEGYGKLNDAIRAANEQADGRIAEMRSELDQQQRTYEETYRQRFEQLDEERAEFEKQKATFDDRQRTHARRKHEELLREVIDKHRSFEISEKTTEKRRYTSRACYIAWTIALALYATVLMLVWRNGSMQALHWSMLATATVLAGSTLVFYIRWSDAWFRRHAEIELEARYLEADFIRASWLVEMMFEWQKESDGQPFPEDALRTLTEGLFERTTTAVVDHPVSQLISSLGRIKSFEAGKGAIKAEAAENK